MKESPLQTIVQASEIFQEFLKLAAIDRFINYWCFELTLQDGIQIPLEDIKEESKHHILGLHSLSYFLQQKLEEDNHETGLNSCSCGWEASCVPKFEHTAIDRYTVGTVIKWSEGECHVLLAPEDDVDPTPMAETFSDAEDPVVKSNDDELVPETNQNHEEQMQTTAKETMAEISESSFFQKSVKQDEEEPGKSENEQTVDYSSDIDEDNSRMLVINEDISNEEKDKENTSSSHSFSIDQALTQEDSQSVSKPPSPVESENDEESEDNVEDDDDSSSISSSSSSSSSYSSTSSDDDDRISFKQRVEQAAKAAREAEATAAANSSEPAIQEMQPSQHSTAEEVISARNPDDIQAAQGLAALGKSPDIVKSDFVKPVQRSKAAKNSGKISQKLIESQAFNVIRVNSNKFQCSVCGRQYDRHIKVLEHQTTHTGQKPWQCDQCGKKFTNYSSLLVHQRAKHTPLHLQQFNCYICQKNFGSQGRLQVHMNTHASRKPYACTICERTFALKTTRDTHEAQHTGNRPWQCNVCGKAYITKYKLNLHMKAHTGELFCSLCNREFNSQDVLTRHKKKHDAGLIPARNAATFFNQNKNTAKRRATSKKAAFVNFPPEFKCQVCSKVFSKSTDLSHHLSFCTSIAYCPSNQACNNPPEQPSLMQSEMPLPQTLDAQLPPSIESCLEKKINPYSCPTASVTQDNMLNRPYMINEIPAEDLTPTLNYQQVIHPNDPILQSLHSQSTTSGVANLPDFLKEVTFGSPNTSDPFSNSH